MTAKTPTTLLREIVDRFRTGTVTNQSLPERLTETFTDVVDSSSTVIRDASLLGYTQTPSFYVSNSGSNNNSGLSLADAFETLEYAISYVASLRWSFDIGFCNIILDDGDYVLPAKGFYPNLPQLIGSSSVYIYSNSGDRADVTIDCEDGLVQVYSVSEYYFSSVTLDNVSGLAVGRATLSIYDVDVNFTQLNKTAFSATNGGLIEIAGTNNFDFAQGNYAFFDTRYASYIDAQGTINLSGTLTFSGAFAIASRHAGITCRTGTTINGGGAATGKRYDGLMFGRIFTDNAGANFFPGNAAGSVDGSSTYY